MCVCVCTVHCVHSNECSSHAWILETILRCIAVSHVYVYDNDNNMSRKGMATQHRRQWIMQKCWLPTVTFVVGLSFGYCAPWPLSSSNAHDRSAHNPHPTQKNNKKIEVKTGEWKMQNSSPELFSTHPFIVPLFGFMVSRRDGRATAPQTYLHFYVFIYA